MQANWNECLGTSINTAEVINKALIVVTIFFGDYDDYGDISRGCRGYDDYDGYPDGMGGYGWV